MPSFAAPSKLNNVNFTSSLHFLLLSSSNHPVTLRPRSLPQIRTPFVLIWNGRTDLWMCSFPRLRGEAERNKSVLTRSSPRLISTGQLNTSLHLHLRPINDIVYVEPYSILDERSYLRGGFTLRCLQRLSRPNVATQLCPWQDNWCTRGSSIPVLSY